MQLFFEPWNTVEFILVFLTLSICLQSFENYKETAEQYNQAATKAEARIR